MRAHIHSEKAKSIPEIVDEAGLIFKDVKSRGVDPRNVEDSDVLLRDIEKKYPDFSKAYPVVIRYMCQLQEYAGAVFQRWLIKVKATAYPTEDQYLDLQADYVTKLYKYRLPNATSADLVQVRANVTKMLKHERDQFKECVDKSTKTVEEILNMMSQRNKDELISYIESSGPSLVDTLSDIKIIVDETVPGPAASAELLNDCAVSTYTPMAW
jgi:hypothetical protein